MSDPQFEILPPSDNSALEAITRGEVDIQIATAHKFPRSMATFKKRALEMATLDEETAASCIYSRPVGKGPDGKQKFAEGLSVRMAEIVGASYGNLRVGAMLIEQTERQVKARGFAHDLETNFASTSEVVESTVKKDGRPYDERMRVVIAKACLSKARRDATFQVVPKALCKAIESECRRVAIGDASTLASRRAAVMTWIGKLGIDIARVFAALSVSGEDDIGLDELATLTGIKTAIKDGDVTVDEAFPFAHAETETPTAESLAGKSKAPKETKATAPKTEEPAATASETETPTDSTPGDDVKTGLIRRIESRLAKDDVKLKYFMAAVVGSTPGLSTTTKLLTELSADQLDGVDNDIDTLIAKALVTQNKVAAKPE
jgi:hypothetical protein